MTGQNVSRRSTLLRRAVRLLAALGAAAGCLAPGLVSGQGYPPQGVPFHGAPSGSVSGDVENFNGGGMGVLLRGGHVAGDTVGRQDSISHIGAMPYATFGESLMFGDARLVRANQGGLAWSFGAGWRHYFSDVDAVFGLNGYFDRDEITGAHFKEWGIGAELLSDRWEWRGNMYKPFGVQREQVGLRAVADSTVFAGNQVQFDQVRSFAAALEGYDTEIGFLLPGDFANQHQIRAFGGGYYYETEGTNFAGWKARLQSTVSETLELNVQVSNDDTFDTNVIFGVALNLGGYRENIEPNNSRYRLGEPVRRNYTFTTSEVQVRESGITAINPANGRPYEIVHVSSRAGAFQDGTVESPFSTLSAGQAAGGDVIFVHAGSRWDLPPDNTLVMNDDERILGEGLITEAGGDRLAAHFLDVVEIGRVPLASSPDFIDSNFTLPRPSLVNAAGDAVTLASDVEFSGFQVLNAGGNGIFSPHARPLPASGIENAVLSDNLISGTGGDGIQLVDTTGTIDIQNTVIRGTTGAAFHVDGGDASISFTQTSTDADPGLGRIVNDSGHAVRVQDTTGGIVFFNLATIDDDFGQGISIENAAGDVTIDNAVIEDSTSHGINIDGGSGTFRFRSTVRDTTVVDRASLNSVNITNLLPGARVIFSDPISINTRGGAGFNFDGNAGTVDINGDITIAGQAAGSTDPAISFVNNLSTSRVAFRDTLTIADANGVGILLSNNVFDSATGLRAGFAVGSDDTGLTTFSNVDGDNLQIQNDASGVRFRGILSTGRGAQAALVQPAHGILIDNATGRLTFSEVTQIDNDNGVTDSGVQITGSQANILFESLDVNDSTGDAGVLLQDNIAGALGDADLLFTSLSITSANGDGLFAINNSSIRSIDGVIDVDTGTAVDIEDSGINMELQSVSSTQADHGIRIVNTFATPGNVDSFFEIFGIRATPNAGNGGTIDTATVAGAFLRNPGIVRLNQMIFDDNEIGVDVQYTGLTDPPSGLLELDHTDFEQNNVRAIDGLNIPDLLIADARFEDNGDDATNGRETIQLRYNETINDPDTVDPDDYDFPFAVSILRSDFQDDTDDIVDLRRLVGAEDAHLALEVADNRFETTDGLDPDAADLNDDAFIVVWEGPLQASFTGNTFNLLAQNNNAQHGIDIFNDHLTDTSEIDILGNTFDIRNDNDTTTNARYIGIALELDGPGFVQISNNNVQMRGGDNTGMLLDLNRETNLTMIANTILDASFDSEGIEVDRIGEGSLLTFDQNDISINGNFGLRVDAFGVIRLDGPNRPNSVFANGFGSQDFIFNGPTPIGQLQINGNLVP